MVPYSLSSMSDESRVAIPSRPLWKRFLVDWGPAIFWGGMIFFFSTDRFSSSNTSSILEPLLSALFSGITPEQFDAINFLIRKFAHLSEYFIFSLLLIRALGGGLRSKLEFRRAVGILMAVLLYALSDEFHQAFVPSRTASLADVGIDWFAGICGILWMYICPMGKSDAADAAHDTDKPSEFCKKT